MSKRCAPVLPLSRRWLSRRWLSRRWLSRRWLSRRIAPPLVDTLIPSRIPSREETPHRRRRFSAEIAPALITVSICSFMILLSQWFDPAFAVVVASVLMLIGVVGLVRGVPLAKAYTFGLVVAALLIRFS
jgi:hypothetical protein